MVASALAAAAEHFGFTAQVLPRVECDITDADAVKRQLGAARPAWIMHTAALTRVNYCEQHHDEAFAVNAEGTAHVVAAAQELNARLVYFSTDYVFDGCKREPWLESDPPHPLNTYGLSKLAGEQVVQHYARGHVVRTSGVFGPRADDQPERNFFRALVPRLRNSAGNPEVVSDQHTAVTYAPDLAEMVLRLLPGQLPPLVHLTSSGSNSWYHWARLAAAALKLDPEQITPVTTAARGDPTPRPGYCVLGTEYEAAQELIAAHPAPAAVATYVRQLPPGKDE